jgi:CheY-like chemotaxis protein
MISVLYVDDEPLLLKVGKLYLEQEGEFVVETYLSANQVFNALLTSNYDAILSDYEMPEMNGIELLKNVRNSGLNTPFIIFTARRREDVVIQALNEGMDFYLQKGGKPGPQFAELSHKTRKAVLQRESEEALLESEERFRTLLQRIPVVAVQENSSG